MPAAHDNDKTPAAAVTVTFAGRRYRVQRRTQVNGGEGPVSEFWTGHGVVGSYRKWLGGRHSARLYWYAAVNPNGQPYTATTKADELPSRRAAITWLLTNAPQPEVETQ